jgi:hypothetical protein
MAGKMGMPRSAVKTRAFHGKSALWKALTPRTSYRGGVRFLPHRLGTARRRSLIQEKDARANPDEDSLL